MRTAAEAFRAAAARDPEWPAVIAPDRVWSYGELDGRSARMAAALRGRVPDDGSPVAVALPTGAEAVIAALAVWRAGHALLPVDVRWPEGRIAEVLSEASARALLTDAEGPRLEGLPRLECASLDADAPDNVAAPEPPRIAAIPFTSGRTGRPKGVLLSHAALLHASDNYRRRLEITPDDRIAWTAPFAYGAALGAYLTALISGATLLPVRPADEPMEVWVERLRRERATVLMLTTSLFRALAQHLPDAVALPDVRCIKIGGEPVHASDAALFRRRFRPDGVLVNGLGITECAGNVCFHPCAAAENETDGSVPVGVAADGMELLVLDERGAPVREDGAGEIAVRSAWLADGYVGAAAAENHRFAPLPDDPRPVYRTGDRGRRDREGRLVHLGPLDLRAKIRGFSVDLLEVEAALRGLPGVLDAAVAARTLGGSAKLVAWVQARTGGAWKASTLRTQLGGRLPAHALPALVQPVAALPRLENGKLDRAALAGVPLVMPSRAARVKDPLQVQLMCIWERALGVQGIGVDDDFYDLGGDSLAAMSLFTLLEQRMGISLPMLHISSCPTIACMAARLRGEGGAGLSTGVVLLQAGESAEPVFLLPGGGMDASSLVDLARHLGPAYTVYGLQLPGLHGQTAPCYSVEESAEQLERELLRRQPEGAYRLLGVSYGGLLAWAIARRLRARGAEVRTLALMDTFGRGSLDLKPGIGPFGLLRAWWYRQFPHRPRRRAENRWRRVQRLAREQWRRLVTFWWLRWGWDWRRVPPMMRFDYIARVCNSASRAYTPPPLDVPVDLFVAREQPLADIFRLPPDMGWGPFARAGLRIHSIPGAHATCFREPHAAATAAVIAACLRTNDAAPLDAADPSEARLRWDALAGWWDEQLGADGASPGARALAPVLDRLLGDVADRTVLEIACGNGWYARRLAARGARVTACDGSAQFVQRARTYAAAGPPIRYEVVDATRAASWEILPPGPFDAAVCNLALMDIADVRLVFSETARRLKPGASFVCSVLNPDAPGLRELEAGAVLTHISLPGAPASHYYFHRRREDLLRLAAAAGFRLDSAEVHTAPAREGQPPESLLVLHLRAPSVMPSGVN
ncbi:MAG TPA: alpha/beta fold hydrolase [Kiritimatiellia bacterium]|nr:alpha/beta fold hydrolase [Kiritimatiellia bacterium]